VRTRTAGSDATALTPTGTGTSTGARVAPALTPAPTSTAVVAPLCCALLLVLLSNPSDLSCLTGPKAFSEPEETALASYIKSHPNVNGYIDWHSYSQLWLGVRRAASMKGEEEEEKEKEKEEKLVDN